MATKPKCIQCIHYQVTYNPRQPHGCKAYRFQGMGLPSLTIKKETGQDCLAYEQRKNLKKKKVDLNDPSLW